MVGFEKANFKDAQELVSIQVRTFDDDARKFNKTEKGGPPGYDSVDWQIEMMKNALYYKILNEGKIIGGIIVFLIDKGHYELGRIYIDPAFQNRGIGFKAMSFLESNFKDATKWTLGTPEWAIRNHYFYEKAGFKKVGEEGPLPEGLMEIRYEKVINNIN